MTGSGPAPLRAARPSFDGTPGLTQHPPGPHAPACAAALAPAEADPVPVPEQREPAAETVVLPEVPIDIDPPDGGSPFLGGIARVLGVAPEAERLRHYQAGAALARAGLAAVRPEAAEALRRTVRGDVVVVKGGYDRVETVLDHLGIPYVTVEPRRLAGAGLRPEQTLLVNCPGDVGARGRLAVRRFVRDGGTLLSTDWALRGLAQVAFPGVLLHNGMKTSDTVVGVRPRREPHPLLEGAFERGDDARWWLEIDSYPILVVARPLVTVPLKSTELMVRWGAAPVAVHFEHGRGEVFHMVSHFYLQRSDESGARLFGGSAAEQWAESRGGRFRAGQLSGMTVRQLQSATSSARLLVNLIAEKRARVEGERHAYR